jgi:hypothetical protein
MNLLKKYLDLWKEIIGILGFLIGVTIFIWNTFAIPKIQVEINKIVIPMENRVKTLEYKTGCMNYIITKHISQDTISKDLEEYYLIVGKPNRHRDDK